MPDSAAALAEKLVTKSQSAKDSDVILFAKVISSLFYATVFVSKLFVFIFLLYIVFLL